MKEKKNIPLSFKNDTHIPLVILLRLYIPYPSFFWAYPCTKQRDM